MNRWKNLSYFGSKFKLIFIKKIITALFICLTHTHDNETFQHLNRT
jgi:hypothetical protein